MNLTTTKELKGIINDIPVRGKRKYATIYDDLMTPNLAAAIKKPEDFRGYLKLQTMKQKIIELLKNHNLTVESVQKAGFRVYISHFRYLNFSKDGLRIAPLHTINLDDRIHGAIKPKGGKTVVEIVDKETGFSLRGEADCSVKDAYVKNVGINLAINRVLRNMLVEIRRKDNLVHSE